jgi:hypothetical protein
MTNKQILEDYKERISYPGFAVFYCKELDKHLVRRLPVKNEEKQVVLSEFEKNVFHLKAIVYQLNLQELLLKVKFIRKGNQGINPWIPS